MNAIRNSLILVVFAIHMIAVHRINLPPTWSTIIWSILHEGLSPDQYQRVKTANRFLDQLGFASGSGAVWNMFAWNAHDRWTYEIRSSRGDLLYRSALSPAQTFNPLLRLQRFRFDRFIHQAYRDDARRQQFLKMFCRSKEEVRLTYLSIRVSQQHPQWKEYPWSSVQCQG